MPEVIDFKTKRMLSKHRKKQKEKVKDAKFEADRDWETMDSICSS